MEVLEYGCWFVHHTVGHTIDGIGRTSWDKGLRFFLALDDGNGRMNM